MKYEPLCYWCADSSPHPFSPMFHVEHSLLVLQDPLLLQDTAPQLAQNTSAGRWYGCLGILYKQRIVLEKFFTIADIGCRPAGSAATGSRLEAGLVDQFLYERAGIAH